MVSRAEFKQIPVDVFNAMGDVVVDGTLRHYSSAYAAGGNVTNTPTDYAVRLVEDQITERELAAGIARAGDRKFLTPESELAVRPKVKDSIVITAPEAGAETIFNVYAVDTDPATALWTILTRQ